MGVIAVYALNDEFKSILREAKNGMVSPMSYVVAKSVMVVPVIYIISLFALIVPGFLIMKYDWAAFGPITLLWSVMFFCFESLAECLAVWIEDPIIGMLQFMNFWCKRTSDIVVACSRVSSVHANICIAFVLQSRAFCSAAIS